MDINQMGKKSGYKIPEEAAGLFLLFSKVRSCASSNATNEELTIFNKVVSAAVVVNFDGQFNRT